MQSLGIIVLGLDGGEHVLFFGAWCVINERVSALIDAAREFGFFVIEGFAVAAVEARAGAIREAAG